MVSVMCETFIIYSPDTPVHTQIKSLVCVNKQLPLQLLIHEEEALSWMWLVYIYHREIQQWKERGGSYENHVSEL